MKPSTCVVAVSLYFMGSLQSTDVASARECDVRGTAGRDRLVGTPSPDVICGLGGRDRLFGRGGNDLLVGGIEADRIYGGKGDDFLIGGRGRDLLYGRSGSDVINAKDGADLLVGNEGRDCLRSRDDNPRDRIFGGPGRDVAGADAGDLVRAVAVRTTQARPDCSAL